MQDDLGAATGLLHRFDAVVAGAFRFPAHALRCRQAGAPRDERDPVRDDESGIKSDAELADQVGVVFLVAGELLEELFGPGLGDGADVGDDLVARHADAVVGHGNGAIGLVHADADFQVGIVLIQSAIGNGRKAQLVRRIRRIGNEFSQEYLLVAVQGVDHQVEELLYFGLKTQLFFDFGHELPLLF